MLQQLRALFRRNAETDTRPPPDVSLSEAGFALHCRDHVLPEVPWSEVKEIFAFKRDCLGVDLVCMGFRVSEGGEYWELDEEMAGWKELTAEVERRFPDIDRGWWSKVAFPAFETNYTTLWGEPVPRGSET